MTKSSKTSTHWPVGLWVVAVVVGVMLFLVGGLYVLGGAATGRWHRYTATLRADGAPFSLKELEAARIRIPDERNSALVIEKLKDDLDTLADERADDDVFVFGSRPRDTLADRNMYTDFFTGISRGRVETSRKFLDDHRDLLDKIGALRDMPSGHMVFLPPNYQGSAFSILLPYFGPMRAAAKLVRVEAMVRLVDGNTAGVVGSAKTLAAIAGSLNEYPNVIGKLVQISIENLFVQTVEDLLRVSTPDNEVLASLERIIETRLSNSTMKWAFLGERACFAETCSDFISGKLTPAGATVAGGGGMPPFLPTMLIRKNQIRGTEMLSWLVDAEDTRALMAAANRMEKEARALPLSQVITKTFLPSLSRAVILHGFMVSELRCAKTSLAAERFRLQTGRLPSALAQLVPEYLDAIPDDPFDGEPMRLSVNDQGIVIYSVGDNLFDDGGDVEVHKKKPRYPDIGFRLLKPEHRGLLLVDEPERDDTLP